MHVRRTGCFGFCERGPVVAVRPDDTCYLQVQESDVDEIVKRTVGEGKVVDRLLYENKEGKRVRALNDIPFYTRQSRVLLDANTRIDPTSIEDYIAEGGYRALAKVLTESSPEQVIDLVKESGLRGVVEAVFRRGGSGNPRATQQTPRSTWL